MSNFSTRHFEVASGSISAQPLIKILSLIAAFLIFFSAQPASACVASIYKQSVVVNTLPQELPGEVVAYRVRIEEALFWEERSEIQGLRGVLLEAAGGLEIGAILQVTGRLTSNCDTWIEYWSSDHEAEGDLLIGYIVGKQIGFVGDTNAIKPMLFHNTRARKDHGLIEGEWMNERASIRNPEQARRRFRISRDAIWRGFRVDIEELGKTLDRVNQAIQDETERLDKEDVEGRQQ